MTDLFEHQGKALFAAAGIPVPRNTVVRSPAEAALAAKRFGYPLVVKAQVLSGGRGKAGGIRRVADVTELASAAADILDLEIRGKPVVSLLLEEALDIVHEYYLAFALDRAARRPVLLFSPNGGVDVEAAAAGSHGVTRVAIDPLLGLRPHQIRTVVSASGLHGSLATSLARIVGALWGLYLERDATLTEINPLGMVHTPEGAADREALVAIDAKITLDDSAHFRRKSSPERAGQSDLEGRAREAGFSYVRLQGDIGVLGNGAGLVMTLVDLLADAGGRAADFLDIGGGASRERVEAALDILLDDDRLGVLLVVVFGGITRCDEVARGLLAALEGREAAPPVVVQLSGTNAELAADLLADGAGPAVVTTHSLAQAVSRAAELAASAESRPASGHGALR